MKTKSLILNLKSLIIGLWPIAALLLINILLFATNYKPGTYLTGWDNLHPEFAPLMNIQRGIFAVWQEYQSLGLLGGMGHASDLVRQILVLFLTFVLPLSLVRYITTFTMLFLGSAGAYFLTHYLLNKTPKDPNHKSSIINHKSVAFIASLFYLLNIATIQTFYAPFEAFIAHFASLPWLLLSSILFLASQTRPSGAEPTPGRRRNLIFLTVVLMLSTPGAYIPTLFVVYILAILIYILVTLALNSDKKAYLLKASKLGLIIFIVNAFWLLPFLFFTFTKSYVNIESKINQMATGTIYEQNKEFGNLSDTALLKGFWFNNVDPNVEGLNTYMFTPWRDHFSNPLVPAAGYFLFGLILVGAFSAFFKLRNHKSEIYNQDSIAFAILFIFAFTMLATAAFPFSLFDELFRKLPLFGQAFRFPFTKFNSLTALTYSIMLAFGFLFIISTFSNILSKRIKNQELRFRGFLLISCFILLTSSILWIASPVFSGKLFYSKNTVDIPKEYFSLFEYFKTQDQNARIANLPQPTFWGWTFYRWGVGGSGFIWYGIKQPILDRAFDVWSEESENYYYELSSALYGRNSEALTRVLNKYQISFIVLDKNVYYPHAPHVLFYDETEKLLSNMPNVKKDRAFGNISVYKVDLRDKPASYVFLKGELPRIETNLYKTRDGAYEKYGNYISGKNKLIEPEEYLPFSLFTLKSLKKPIVKIEKNSTEILISSQINLIKNSTLILPEYSEKIIQASFYKTIDSEGDTQISAIVKTPAILLDGKKVSGNEKALPLFKIPKSSVFPLTININGTPNITVHSESEGLLGTSFLSRSVVNQIVVSGSDILDQAKVANDDYEDIFENKQTIRIPAGKHTLTVTVPKIEDSYLSFYARGADAKSENCNTFRAGPIKAMFANQVADITTANSSRCLSFFSETLTHDLAYSVFVGAKNDSGRPLRFWILNEDQKSSPVDTYLDTKKTEHTFILPFMEENGDSYSFHFDNSAIGKDVSKNILSYIEAYPVPQKYIENISLNIEPVSESPSASGIIKISHPNESHYSVTISGSNTPSTLVLSQAFNPGWKAYLINNPNFVKEAIPFIFGREIKEHVEVNSWENGWMISPNTPTLENRTIIITYIPQYLEYMGFIFILVLPVFILLKMIKKHPHSKS